MFVLFREMRFTSCERELTKCNSEYIKLSLFCHLQNHRLGGKAPGKVKLTALSRLESGYSQSGLSGFLCLYRDYSSSAFS